MDGKTSKRKMGKWIDYFDLLDAFKKPGCLFCNRLKELSLKFLDNLFYKRVMLVYLHLSLDIELPPPLTDLLKIDWLKFQVLDTQYFSDEILKLLGKPLRPLQALSSFQFHPKDNLQTLRKKVSILLNHGMDFDGQEITKWVQFFQNGDGGFGFYPETTSYMENTYCALEILSKLHSSPTQLDLCRKYILGCQTKSGGFGKAPHSFPYIESTYHAVMGLLRLGEMEGGNT